MKYKNDDTYIQTVFLPGVRIKVKHLNCDVNVNVGEKGTVVIVDAQNTIHVKFDNGLCLGLIYDQDEFEIIE